VWIEIGLKSLAERGKVIGVPRKGLGVGAAAGKRGWLEARYLTGQDAAYKNRSSHCGLSSNATAPIIS